MSPSKQHKLLWLSKYGKGDQIVAAYARRNELIQALDLKRYEDAAAAEARLKSIQESRDKQTYDAEVAKYARRNELIQALDLKRYEDAAAASQSKSSKSKVKGINKLPRVTRRWLSTLVETNSSKH